MIIILIGIGILVLIGVMYKITEWICNKIDEIFK